MSFATHQMLDGIDRAGGYPGMQTASDVLDYKIGVQLEAPQGPGAFGAPMQVMQAAPMQVMQAAPMQAAPVHFAAPGNASLQVPFQNGESVTVQMQPVEAVAEQLKAQPADLQGLAARTAEAYTQGRLGQAGAEVHSRLGGLEKDVGEIKQKLAAQHEGLVHHTKVLKGQQEMHAKFDEALLDHRQHLETHAEQHGLVHEALKNHQKALQRHARYGERLEQHGVALQAAREELQLHDAGLRGHTSALGKLGAAYKVQAPQALSAMQAGVKQHSTKLAKKTKPAAVQAAPQSGLDRLGAIMADLEKSAQL